MIARLCKVGLVMLVSGCTTLGGGTKTVTPKPISAPLTATVGNLGISGGGLVGGPLGTKLEPADKLLALNAEYKALEYGAGGASTEWISAKGSIGGKVLAGQPYRVGSQDCRQYNHTITSAGVDQSARGTACRNSDGTWSLLE